MIIVKPVFGDELSSFFTSAGLEFNENSGCTVARDGDEILGHCIYYLDSKGITVCRVEPQNDYALADGILRSALHIAATRSAMDARYSEDAPKKLFEILGFVKDENERTLDIDKLFGGCTCKKE